MTDYLGGELLLKGEVQEKISEIKGGFDVGRLAIKSEDGEYEITYVNEFMTLEIKCERLATFPDLITSFNEDAEPITSAAIMEGDIIYLMKVPKEKILIGDGNRYPEVYEEIKFVTGKKITEYLDGFLIAN